MEKQFRKSLDTLKKSNGEFFLVDVGRENQTIKFVIAPSVTQWVRFYKYEIWEAATQFIKKDGDEAFIEKYVVLYYFYSFVMPDILKLQALFPERINTALNIGAGIGLIDVFLYQYYGGEISLTMTELDMMFEITNTDGSSIPLSTPLNTLGLLRDSVNSNHLKNFDVISSASIGNHLTKKFDYVFSFRSWGYLYGLDEYIQFVNDTLSDNGVVITDLSEKYGSEEKFNKYFKNCVLIQQSGNGKRWMGYKR